MSLPDGLERLRDTISRIGPMAVGFSAGVDSTLLLWAAHDVLGERAVGVTTVSASLPWIEKQEAARIAREIGAPHRFVDSGEMEDPRFLENGNRRCYFCKTELFQILRQEAARLGLGAVAYGAQKDDLGEFRPGMEAAREHGARAPLLEAGLGKAEIREISRHLGLSTWNKPAMACLSSRIPHGTPITPKVLGRVERAEEAVRAEGFRLFRVRAKGDAARLELARDEMGRLDENGLRQRLIERILQTGYASVFIDPLGYRPGGAAAFGNEAGWGLESPG
ncbi:MAG TPA: ATP-dependent sacrificial sulfur transferase LarE [Candidatus Polarisedimenticolia bacterium]|nr:ATP-dependent sacrificial sulfur transferase LarE [Candidatus Polarisedimenticolia bacterium]